MFEKGNKLSTGRPKGSVNKEKAELFAALKAAAQKKGLTFLKSYVERSYKSDPMAIALLKKLVPDLTENNLHDFDINLVVMSKAEAIDYHKRKLALYAAQDAVKDGIAEE